jgi:uncharacterized protein (TIGR03435 family)
MEKPDTSQSTVAGAKNSRGHTCANSADLEYEISKTGPAVQAAARSAVFWAVAIACAVGGIVSFSSAQTPESPAFEVASVKRNTSGPFGLQRVNIQPGDRVTVTNVPLLIIIQAAFRLGGPQIQGGPGWINTERFDITAKADAPTSAEQLHAMLRTLLADRFKLAVHTEERNAPIYALVLLRRDGKLGPNLRIAEADCATLRAAAQGGQPPGSNNSPCGFVSQPNRTAMRGVTMDQLAGQLSRATNGVKVVNKTGLSGFFDFDITWTPDASRGTFDRARFPSVDPDGPSIFTAVQEQLGLKLESQKGEGEVLVIDRVDHPTED